MTPIRATVALESGTGRDALEAAFLGEERISIASFVPAVSDGLAQIGDDHDALVVACAGESEETLAFIARASRERPERPVIVVHEGANNGFVQHAFAAGADDLVPGSFTPGMQLDGTLGRDIAFALEKALARRSGIRPGAPAEQSAPVLGEMIVILGPKGGTGKTLTSCNLAAALARAGQNVILADLDLQFGDVGLAYGLSPQHTIYELATSGGSLDAEKVADFLTLHESGVRVLMAPRRPDHAAAVSPEFLRGLFGTLREMADFVIVDTPPTFTPEVIVAIDRSTAICVVAMLDALSLKNTKLALETLELMDYDPSRVRVVLNRADSRVGVTPEDAKAILGRGPDVLVPSHRDITRSVNEGMPIVLTKGHVDARRAFESLAVGYIPTGRAKRGQPTSDSNDRRWFGLRRVEA